MILAFASAAHGNNLISKGILIAISAALWGLIAAAATNWLLAVVIQALVVGWWFMLRGSKQAKVELDKMDTINPPHPSMMDVLKAHYYTGILTCVSLYFFNYDKRPDLVNNGKFWDCRRPTEFATGLTADVVLSALLLCISL